MRGRRWGFSLEDVRQWLEIYDQRGTDAQLANFLELADQQLVILEKERVQLEDTIADLSKFRDGIKSSIK